MLRQIVAMLVAIASAFVLAQDLAWTQSLSIDRLERKLLRASSGVQYPGSESDSAWTFVSYPDEEELPDAATFEQLSGCPVTEYGGTSRLDYETFFDRLTTFQPWMDEGQRASVRGFRKIERVMLRSYGERTVYRCDTGEFGQVHYYFVGLNDEGISGLLTVSTET